MNATKLTFLFGVISALSACNSTTENKPPEIQWILTDVKDLHPSYIALRGYPGEYTLGFDVSVKVNDPDGQDDITDISFASSAGVEFPIKSETEKDRWDASLGIYTRRSYDPALPNSVDINGWTLTVVDSAGHSVSKTFSLVLPNRVSPTDESFIYSHGYTGIETGGAQALISPTFNSIEKNVETTELTFNFTPVDSRTNNYRVWLYDNNGNAVAQAKDDVITAPGTIGSANIHTLTNNDLLYLDGYSFENIEKLVWLSQDDMSTSADEVGGAVKWWRYRTFSEVQSYK
jgi:hypothetical protein